MLRFLEIVLTCLAMLVLMPVMVAVAVLIVLDSGFPVFFMSPRIGRQGQPFMLFYFRTMRPGTDPASQRLTRVGRFLRNYSLDHLPQVFNLLRGEMHLVGPRPMRPEEVDLTDDNYQRALTVKPGVLNPAVLQLGRHYNPTDFAIKARLEKMYLEERSAGRDTRFVGDMLRALVRSRGNVKTRGEPRVPVDTDG